MGATSLPVTVIQKTTPALAVQPSGRDSDYKQLKNSLGNISYAVDKVYVFSDQLKQIQGSFQFAKYDSSGNQRFITIPSTIDPYQASSAIFINTKGKGIKFDGRDFIRFNALPNTTIGVKIYAIRTDNQTLLNKYGKNNFQKLEEIWGKKSIFEEFNDYL